MTIYEFSLEKLGIKEGIIYEAIATTSDKQNTPNAAPVGFVHNKKRITLKLFKNTRTYRNILDTQLCTLNLCNDGILFFYTAFKEITEEKINLEKKGNYFHLVGAGACIDLETEQIKNIDNDRDLIICRIKRITIYKPHINKIALTRADTALIEATIHATRIPVFLEKNDTDKVRRLITLINHYSSVINRVSPRTEYEKCIDKLLMYVNKLIEKKFSGPVK